MVCGPFPVTLVFNICTDGSGHKQTVLRGLLFLSGHTCFVSLLSLWIHMRQVAIDLHAAAQVKHPVLFRSYHMKFLLIVADC